MWLSVVVLSLCRVIFSRNLAIFASMLGSIASIIVSSVLQWWFRWVGAAHNILHPADPTKCRTWAWLIKHELAHKYLVLPSMLIHLAYIRPCAWDYRSVFILHHLSRYDAKNVFFCVFEATVYRSFCAFRHPSASTRTAPNFFAF